MTGIFSDRYKLSLLLASLFMLGIGVSLYFIYSLPHALHLNSGYGTAFSPVYVVLGITFLIGCIALIMALRYKKELILFIDRDLEAAALLAAVVGAERNGDRGEPRTVVLLDQPCQQIGDRVLAKIR